MLRQRELDAAGGSDPAYVALGMYCFHLTNRWQLLNIPHIWRTWLLPELKRLLQEDIKIRMTGVLKAIQEYSGVVGGSFALISNSLDCMDSHWPAFELLQLVCR